MDRLLERMRIDGDDRAEVDPRVGGEFREPAEQMAVWNACYSGGPSGSIPSKPWGAKS